MYNKINCVKQITQSNSNRTIYNFFNRVMQSLPLSPATDFGIFGITLRFQKPEYQSCAALRRDLIHISQKMPISLVFRG